MTPKLQAAIEETDRLSEQFSQRGISLRDWFAGLAMHGIYGAYPDHSLDAIAKCAYEQADAMLSQRKPGV